MPTSIEAVIQPTEQDLIDLEKIYKDYPVADCDFSKIQPLLNEASAIRVYAIRFNDRLLGAISTSEHPDQANTLSLDHLCVRALTRQRHVGRDLFRLLTNLITDKTLVLTPCMESEALDKTMQQAGFSKQANSWVLQR